MADYSSISIRRGALQPFFDQTGAVYHEMRDTFEPLMVFALLLGRTTGTSITLEGFSFCKNARHQGDFMDTGYGGVYSDVRRAFIADDLEVLRATREAAKRGQQVIGTIHVHTDVWNQPQLSSRNPESQNGTVIINEMPTRFDQEMFRGCGWPLNMIYYIGEIDGIFLERLTAWVPSDEKFEANYKQVPWYLEAAIDRTPGPDHQRVVTAVRRRARGITAAP